MIEQCGIHGGHAGERSRLGPLHRLERLGRIPARQHDDFTTAQDCPIEHGRIRKDMEEGQHAHDTVFGRWIRIKLLDLTGIGRDILVRQHRALGRAGRAACILDQRDILARIDRDAPAIALVIDHFAERDNITPFRDIDRLATLKHAEHQ